MIAEIWNQRKTQKEVTKGRDKAEQLIKDIQLPDFDYSKLTPEDMKILQKWHPEVAEYVVEKAPELVRLTEQGQMGRDAQMSALDKYRGLSQTGEDAQSRLLQDAALRDAAIQAQGQRASIQDQMARRGQGGGGLDLAAQLMAQQAADQRGALTSQQGAMNAYNTRLDALKNSAALGGDIRGEDVALESLNTGRTNDAQQRAAAQQNLYNQYASNERNKGNLYNLEAHQQAEDKNVQQRNSAMQEYINRYNKNQMDSFNAQARKQGMRGEVQNKRIQDYINAGRDRSKQIGAVKATVGAIVGGMYGGGAGASTGANAGKASSPETGDYGEEQ